MIVNRANVSAIFTNLLTIFNKALQSAPSDTVSKIATIVPSTTKQKDYTWLSRFPKMRKWIGEKYRKRLEAYKHTIENDDYEATVEVKRNDIDDDNIGIYGPMAQAAGQSAAELPSDVVIPLVNDSFVNLAYDGQYVHDTDHEVNGASVSNKITAALKAGTLAEAQASYGAAKLLLTGMKDEEGQSLKLRPKVLLVPSALEDTAKILMGAEKFADGSVNPYKGDAEVVVEPDLTSSTAWFLLDNSKPIRTYIYQDRKKPVFVNQTSADSDEVFSKGNFLFSAEARAGGGYGFWQMSIGSTGTV